jgi:hypothetical protein
MHSIGTSDIYLRDLLDDVAAYVLWITGRDFRNGQQGISCNIEVVKMIPETGEVILTGKSKLERCIETR